MKRSGLRGRGGAGFSTGTKWGFVPNIPGPKYVCCNADESEPGTFNNRAIMEWDPHIVVEGVMIASYAIGATHSFIYCRGEFGLPARDSTRQSWTPRRRASSARTSSARAST